MALIGIGVRRLSITPVAVGPLKAMIRSLDRGAITTLMEDLLERPPADMRAALSQWAAEQDVAIA
jgi:phosphotransferase system enzyme I (PtsP)